MVAVLVSLATIALVPGAVACGGYLALRRWAPAVVADRWALALSLGAALAAGYALNVPPKDYWPSRHYHWLPYLGLGAAACGAIGAAPGLSRADGWVLQALTAVVAACLLVPAWPELWPPRPISLATVTVYLFVLAAGTFAGAARGPRSAAMLAAVAAVSIAALAAIYVSLTYAALAGIAAAGISGSSAGLLIGGGSGARGLALPYAVLVGGWSYAIAVEPREPLWGLLVPGLLPAIYGAMTGLLRANSRAA